MDKGGNLVANDDACSDLVVDYRLVVLADNADTEFEHVIWFIWLALETFRAESFAHSPAWPS